MRATTALLLATLPVAWLCTAQGAEELPRISWIASMRVEAGYGDQDVGGPEHLSVRPCLNRGGTRLYFICNSGPADAPWEVEVTEPPFRNRKKVTENARNELAVIPSPDDTKLLLLVEVEGGAALVVTDVAGNDLATVADGLDAARSQFAWSFDGTFIYYSAPAADGAKTGLHRATPDGASVTPLLLGTNDEASPPVDEFDACRTRDRVVARTGGALHVLDEGRAALSFQVKGPVEGLRVSPDGTRVAWGGDRIVIFNLDDGKIAATSSLPDDEPAFDRAPAWSPDGTQVAFERCYCLGSREGPTLDTEVRRLSAADGAETKRWRSNSWHDHLQWSPDGKHLVCECGNLGARYAGALELAPPPELRPAPEGLEWHQANGPYGGWVEAYAVAPSDGRVVYVVMGGSIYATEDAGESWRTITWPEGDRVFSGVAVDPKDARIVYAATEGGTLLRSEDAGATWAEPSETQRGHLVEAVTAHPTEPGVVFALGISGTEVLRYEGDTVTVLRKDERAMGMTRLYVDRHNPDLLVFGSASRLYWFSSDGGKTWHEPKSPEGEQNIVYMAGSPTDSGVVLAQVYSGTVYFTQDDGQSWELYADPSRPEFWTESIQEAVVEAFPLRQATKAGCPLGAPEGAWYWLAAADPKNPDRVYVPVGQEGLYRSDDGGKTWKAANSRLGVLSLQALQPVPGVPGRVVVFGGDGPLVSDDGGSSWHRGEPPQVPSEPFIAAHPLVEGLLFMGTIHGGIYRSVDAGASWEETQPCNLRGSALGWGRCFGFDAHDPDLVTFWATAGVLQSADRGETWQEAARFKPPFGEDAEVSVVLNGTTMTLACPHDRRVFQTPDRGTTWRVVQGPHQVDEIFAVFGHPDKPAALAVLSQRDAQRGSCVLYVSEDSGGTWQIRPLPKNDYSPASVARNPAVPDMLAVGFQDGAVYLSPDDGATWLDFGTGLPRAWAWPLAFSPADNRLYAFMARNGLYWTTLPERE